VTPWQKWPGIPEGEGSDPITEVGLCLAVKALSAKTYPLPISLLVAPLPCCASAFYAEFRLKKMLPKTFPRFPEALFDFFFIYPMESNVHAKLAALSAKSHPLAW